MFLNPHNASLGPRRSPYDAATFRLALFLLGAVPLVVARIAPLQDWPSHLARVGIMRSLLDGEPFWAEYYHLSTFFLPNVALDVGVLALMRLGLELEAAGAVFLLLTYALFVSGFLALSRGSAASPLAKSALAVMLFYSASLAWGFINYTFGLGAAMWAAAWYLASPPHWARKAALAAAAAAVVFACHLVAAACLLILLACQDLAAAWQSRRTRPIAKLALCFAGSAAATLVFITLYALSPAGADAQRGMMYTGSESVSAFLSWKVRTFAKAYLTGSAGSDIVAGAMMVALLGLTAFVRRVRMPLWAILACAALVIVTTLAPQRVGAGAFLDNRLAALPVLVAAATIHVTWRRVMAGHVAVAVLVFCAATRSGTLAVDWSRTGAMLDTLDSHFATLPRRTVLVALAGHPAADVGWNAYWSVPSVNVGVTAVRHGLFVPQVFAIPNQQPLELKAAYQHLSAPDAIRNAGQIEAALTPPRALCDGPRQVHVMVWFPASYLNTDTVPPLHPLLPGISTMEVCHANPAG